MDTFAGKQEHEPLRSPYFNTCFLAIE